jgi:multiple sugar transport system ATP-binding protein
MEDASLVSDAPAERRISSTVELREALGSDVVVHFAIDAPPPVTEEAIELVADVGQELVERVQETVEASRSNMLARLNPRTRALQGDAIELVVDTHRLHFFDPDTGLGVYGHEE